MIAVITAGGASRRFGQDKALAAAPAHAGRPGERLLDRVANGLSGAAVRLLVAPLERGYQLPGWRLVPDLYPGQGPLSGLISGLRAAPPSARGTDDPGAVWLAFAAVDLPGLSPAYWATLWSVAAVSEAEIVCGLDAAGRAQPLAALYRLSLLDRAEQLMAAGERRMAHLLAVSQTHRVPWADLAPLGETLYHNVNTPQDQQ